MDALASAACFNTVRRVILDLAIVFLPVTCLNGDATIYIITGAPHSGAAVAVHRLLKASPRRCRAAGRRIGRCHPRSEHAGIRSPAARKKIRPRPFGRVPETAWQASLGRFEQAFPLPGLLDLGPPPAALPITPPPRPRPLPPHRHAPPPLPPHPPAH